MLISQSFLCYCAFSSSDERGLLLSGWRFERCLVYPSGLSRILGWFEAREPFLATWYNMSNYQKGSSSWIRHKFAIGRQGSLVAFPFSSFLKVFRASQASRVFLTYPLNQSLSRRNLVQDFDKDYRHFINRLCSPRRLYFFICWCQKNPFSDHWSLQEFQIRF